MVIFFAVKRLIGQSDVKTQMNFRSSVCCAAWNIPCYSFNLTHTYRGDSQCLRTEGHPACKAVGGNPNMSPPAAHNNHKASSIGARDKANKATCCSGKSSVVYGFEEVEGATKKSARVHPNPQIPRLPCESGPVKGWCRLVLLTHQRTGGTGDVKPLKASPSSCSQEERRGPRLSLPRLLRAAFGE